MLPYVLGCSGGVLVIFFLYFSDFSVPWPADGPLKALHSLKTNKSPGPDKVYPELLKETKREILSSLTTVFNYVSATRHRPIGLEKG